jgi:hypothetical protein
MLDNTKPWWASRTIWVGLVGAGFAVASALGVVPAGLAQENVLEGVLAVTGVLAAVFRAKATVEVK